MRRSRSPRSTKTRRGSPIAGLLTRPGTLGWAIGLLRVKPLFDRLVGEHLQQAKDLSEKRAARSKVMLGQISCRRRRAAGRARCDHDRDGRRRTGKKTCCGAPTRSFEPEFDRGQAHLARVITDYERGDRPVGTEQHHVAKIRAPGRPGRVVLGTAGDREG